MGNDILERKIDRLLAVLEQAEPVSSDLGTPEIPNTSELRELVSLGPEAVPVLLGRLDQGSPAKRVAIVVVVLRQIGERRALEPLRAVRAQYQALENKGAWEFAVIGQCNLAIEELER